MLCKNKPLGIIFLAVLVAVFLSIACASSPREVVQDDLQGTIVALELTKNYLENQPILDPPAPEPVETEPPPPPIEVEPPPAIEIPEEPPSTPDVNFEGIQFSFDSSLASSVNTAVIPGQNLGGDFMPFETYPTHFEFTFNQFAVRDHFHTARILVYPVEDFQAISTYAQDQFNSLGAVLVSRPGGSAVSSMPFLPLIPAAQIFSAQVSYFEFQNGSGVRYLTMLGQDIYPVDNQHLFYTYQGITQDGRYYISAVLPITHPGLPADGSDLIDEDYAGFINNWDIYITETMRFLGEQPLNTYLPGIQLLDEMMASIRIER